MPPRLARYDEYADQRCPECKHLVYANQKPGDPCLAAVVYDPPRCQCTDHKAAKGAA